MSLQQAVLLVLAAWAVALMLLSFSLVRGLGAVVATLRTGGALGDEPGAWGGPLIGSELPPVSAAILGDADRQAVVFVSSNCGSCHALLEGLADFRPRGDLVIAIRGHRVAFGSLLEGLPGGAAIIDGPDGNTLHSELDITATPAAVTVEAGQIRGSALLQNGLRDLAALDEEAPVTLHTERSALPKTLEG